ncbi:MAG TPA: hypothetical protein VF092_30975 [Longimicrobium sp.]
MRTPRLASAIAAAAISIAAAACGEPGCIELTRPTPLLAESHPVTSTAPNPVIATLPPGRYEYRATEYGKDHQYYELRTPDGSGYVIYDGSITECR